MNKRELKKDIRKLKKLIIEGEKYAKHDPLAYKMNEVNKILLEQLEDKLKGDNNVQM